MLGQRCSLGSLWRWGACLLAWALLGTGPVRAEDGPDSTWTLRLCANAALGQPADNNGAAYELMRRVQGLWPGLKLQVTPLPWARCLQDAEQGRFDGVLSASWTAERAAQLVYPMAQGEVDDSKRLFRLGYVLLRPKGGAAAWDGEAFTGTGARAGQALGAERGYSIVAFARARGATVEDRFPHSGTLLEALKLGRIAGALLAQEHAATLLTDPEWAKAYEISGPILQSKAYHVPVSQALWKAEPARVARLWATIDKARQAPGFKQHYSLALSGGQRKDLMP
jgi:polar amino acid transport system substrate-binding protein